MLTLKDQGELETLLTENGIDISHWGTGDAKHIQDLWNEIAAGESHLQAGPLRRVVQVVQVIIRKGDRILVEAEQELVDGRRRRRRQPPSDKMKPSENVIAAAKRCLVEELNLGDEAFHMLVHTHRQGEKFIDSLSYPGLRTIYTFHYVDAIVSDLPDSGFWVENHSGEIDPVKRHYWIWVPIASIDVPE